MSGCSVYQYNNAFDEFYDNATGQQRKKMLYYRTLLQMYGKNLVYPQATEITGTTNLRELRLRTEPLIRIFHCFMSSDEIAVIVLSAYKYKKKLPQSVIDEAIRRKMIVELEQEGYGAIHNIN